MDNSTAAASLLTEPAMKKLAGRYLSAYLVARATVTFGGLVKFFGWVLFALILIAGHLVGISMLHFQFEIAVGLGVISGLILGWPFYILGVLVQSVAQMQLAALDSAVHSSPFLSDKQKAIVMGLTGDG